MREPRRELAQDASGPDRRCGAGAFDGGEVTGEPLAQQRRESPAGAGLVVGVGCRPGTAAETIVRAVRKVLGDNEVRTLATVDRRAAEPGFRVAAAELRAPTACFTPDELAAVEVPNPAARIAAALGTPSVAEAAALLACEHICGTADLVITKTAVETVTIAAADCGRSR